VGSETIHVAIDATAIASGDTGVAHYTKQHLAHLAQHPEVVPIPFAIGRGMHEAPGLRRVRTPLRVVHRSWQLLRWPTADALVGPVDLVHSVDMVPPPTSRPLVMTIHDTLPLEIPHLYGRRYIQIARAGLARAREAKVICATCEATADRISEVTGVDRSRIIVASPGRRPELGEMEPLVPGPYILAVGSITPRKGFHILVEAVAQLGDDAPPLIVAGPDGWRSEEVRAKATELRLGARVRFLGRISDEHLERLFRHATVFCHPSVAEGFGIPCLEALGFGVPVVAADIPPVREMGAGTIELVEPNDPESLAQGLRRVLVDHELATRMASTGRERAATYTWARMTDRIVGAYHRALS